MFACCSCSRDTEPERFQGRECNVFDSYVSFSDMETNSSLAAAVGNQPHASLTGANQIIESRTFGHSSQNSTNPFDSDQDIDDMFPSPKPESNARREFTDTDAFFKNTGFFESEFCEDAPSPFFNASSTIKALRSHEHTVDLRKDDSSHVGMSLSWHPTQRYCVVKSVDPDGPAADTAKIFVGDIIRGVDGKRMVNCSLTHVVRAMQNGKSVVRLIIESPQGSMELKTIPVVVNRIADGSLGLKLGWDPVSRRCFIKEICRADLPNILNRYIVGVNGIRTNKLSFDGIVDAVKMSAYRTTFLLDLSTLHVRTPSVSPEKIPQSPQVQETKSPFMFVPKFTPESSLFVKSSLPSKSTLGRSNSRKENECINVPLNSKLVEAPKTIDVGLGGGSFLRDITSTMANRTILSESPQFDNVLASNPKLASVVVVDENSPQRNGKQGIVSARKALSGALLADIRLRGGQEEEQKSSIPSRACVPQSLLSDITKRPSQDAPETPSRQRITISKMSMPPTLLADITARRSAEAFEADLPSTPIPTCRDSPIKREAPRQASIMPRSLLADITSRRNAATEIASVHSPVAQSVKITSTSAPHAESPKANPSPGQITKKASLLEAIRQPPKLRDVSDRVQKPRIENEPHHELHRAISLRRMRIEDSEGESSDGEDWN